MKEAFDTESLTDILNDHSEVRSSEFDDSKELTISHLIDDIIYPFSNKEHKERKALFVSFIPNTSTSNHKPLKKDQKKLYSCNYNGCMKKYKSNENLKLHKQNKHEGHKPYQCSYCTSRFSHRNGKRYHERKTHTKLLPYQCNKCCNRFASTSSMKAHAKLYHKHKSTEDDEKVESDKQSQ